MAGLPSLVKEWTTWIAGPASPSHHMEAWSFQVILVSLWMRLRNRLHVHRGRLCLLQHPFCTLTFASVLALAFFTRGPAHHRVMAGCPGLSQSRWLSR